MAVTILIRFLIGGIVVSTFSVISDLLKPKSFAGLFGAAPSIALATLGITVLTEGPQYAATEARSMIFGSIAFFVYATTTSQLLLRYKISTRLVTVLAVPLWLCVAFFTLRMVTH
jgi:uncharacterized membrane protein (GlpM family)